MPIQGASEGFRQRVRRGTLRWLGVGGTVVALLGAPAVTRAEVAHSYESTTPVAIPDADCVNPVTATLTVPDAFRIGDARVGVWISHPNRGQLRVSVVAPDATEISLDPGLGGSADNLNVLFDDTAAANYDWMNHAAPGTYYANRWIPAASLGVLRFGQAAGTWTLKVCDNVTGETGSLERWALFFRSGVVVSTTPGVGATCPGYPFTHYVMVSNATDASADFALSYTSNWPVAGPTSTGGLASGTLATYAVNVWAAPTATHGTTELLTVTATGGGDTGQATATTWVRPFGTYADVANVPAGRGTRDHSVVYSDGKLYKIGGYDGSARAYVDIYDIAGNSWSTGTDLPAARYSLDCVVIGAKLYCAGGYSGSAGTNTLYIYDIAGNSWSTGATLPAARHGYAGVALGGKYYALGGLSSATYLASVVVYDPVAGTWDASVPDMSVPRRYPVAGALGGKVYVAGGLMTSSTAANSTEVYDPGLNSWTGAAPIPAPGWVRAADAVLQDRFLVLAGSYWNDMTASVYALAFDRVAGAWRWLEDLPRSLYGAEADGDGTTMWIVSGRTYSGGVWSYGQYTTRTTACLTGNPGDACDDGLFCTTGDRYDAQGYCAGPTPTDCTDGLACTYDYCDEGYATCQNPVYTGCLIGGACIATNAVDPTDPCQACRPATSRTAYSQVPETTPCDAALFCTVNTTCDAAGQCGGGTQRDCADGLSCTSDGCDEAGDVCTHAVTTGCVIANACVPEGAADPANPCATCQPSVSPTAYSPVAPGMPCEGGLFCTVGTTCDAGGVCGNGTQRDCSDGLGCTNDSCDETNRTCVNAVTTGCAIGNACVAEGAFEPGNPCRSCQPATSTTAWSPVAVNTPCDDGLFCTVNTACDASGNCVGTQRDCSDGISCTNDACDEAMDQCVSTLAAGACRIGGTCYVTDDRNPGNPCEACRPTLATGAWSARDAGGPCGDPSCADGTLTPAPTCDGAGACVAGTPQSCGGAVCADATSCDAACTGDTECLEAWHCSGAACVADLDDGTACDRAAQCTSGHCVDGICCATACAGVCESCDQVGLEGTCTAIPAGTDPDDDCPGSAVCGPAGACVSPQQDGGAGDDGGAGHDGGGTDGAAGHEGGLPGQDAGTPGGTSSGCDCHAANAAAGTGPVLLVLALLGARLRRSRPRP
ncbi:MAG: proprotein convertase P-domain-containing protein [Deltaproteobacteria bacterium]|nr:proprotein convertase P-domain-containing protein [Deltaproteobacteria bacterium]